MPQLAILILAATSPAGLDTASVWARYLKEYRCIRHLDHPLHFGAAAGERRLMQCDKRGFERTTNAIDALDRFAGKQMAAQRILAQHLLNLQRQ